MTTHHIVHDTDRDGWGSAALLLACVKPARAVLHPQRDKDVVALVNGLRVAAGDQVYVLDIPAPADWSALAQPAGELLWVDHHMASWGAARPSWVRAILPTHDEPTTTMRLLVQAEL
ncbi:MAG: hypothetical protein ABW321_18325, partial [Polyangiales bacterium]